MLHLEALIPSTGSFGVAHGLGSGEGFLASMVVEGEFPSTFTLEDGTPRAPVLFGADKDYPLAAFALKDAAAPRFQTILHMWTTLLLCLFGWLTAKPGSHIVATSTT